VFCIAGWLTGPIAKSRNHPYAQAVTVAQAIATGQTQVSGVAVAPKGIEAAPFIVRVKFDILDFVNRLPSGSTGTAAIYIGHLKPTHVVRRVTLHQIAILNFINPF
jgi:hypothetical protein